MTAMTDTKHIPSALSQFLPIEVKGISMHDGSISFGPRNLRIVLGYITNICSFGDFISHALKNNGDMNGAAVTQMAVVRELVRACNNIERVEAENVKLREALAFYADPKTYQANGHPQIDADTQPIKRDDGRRARAALA